MAVTLATRLAPSPDVAFREVSGEGVLLDLESGTYFGLNGVATRAWTVMLEGLTLGEIHRRLVDEYDVDAAVLEADLVARATQLVDNGLVREP